MLSIKRDRMLSVKLPLLFPELQDRRIEDAQYKVAVIYVLSPIKYFSISSLNPQITLTSGRTGTFVPILKMKILKLSNRVVPWKEPSRAQDFCFVLFLQMEPLGG